jgi:hypothetical protein
MAEETGETDKEMFMRLWRECMDLIWRPDVSKLVDEITATHRTLRVAEGRLFMLLGPERGKVLWAALQEEADRHGKN